MFDQTGPLRRLWGGMEVLSGTGGSRRHYNYRCYTARRKGQPCCTNRRPAPMADADAAVVCAPSKSHCSTRRWLNGP
jgi:hypothetical protein